MFFSPFLPGVTNQYGRLLTILKSGDQSGKGLPSRIY